MASTKTRKSQSSADERRSDRRYRIQAQLEYKLFRRRRVIATGRGQTVNVSSTGILFESDQPLPEGCDIELSIMWPVHLNDTAGLKLCVTGRIVRAQDNCIAVRAGQHEFRTWRIDKV